MTEVLKLSLLSPERRVFENIEATELTLTGSEGEIQILPGHAAIIGVLETGPFAYRDVAGGLVQGAISTGFFEVSNDRVSVMAETLELKAEIDVSRAKRAQIAAEEALRAADLDEHRFKKYQLKLQRALIRQQVGGSHG